MDPGFSEGRLTVMHSHVKGEGAGPSHTKTFAII